MGIVAITYFKRMVEDSMYLRWKEFRPLMENLQELFYEKHFADVTIVSDDGIQLTAHKVILSACSSVLRNMLVNNPHPHPMLLMRGIKKTHLMSILKFMYCGETKILRDNIDEFVSICRDLKVNDIVSSDDLDTPVDDEEGFQENTESNQKEHVEGLLNSMEQIDEKVEISEGNRPGEIIEIDLDIEATKPSLTQESTEKMPEKGNCENLELSKLHACKECDYETVSVFNLKRHKYAKHENSKHQYKCEHCDFT